MFSNSPNSRKTVTEEGNSKFVLERSLIISAHCSTPDTWNQKPSVAVRQLKTDAGPNIHHSKRKRDNNEGRYLMLRWEMN